MSTQSYNPQLSSETFTGGQSTRKILYAKNVHKPEIDENYYSRYGNEYQFIKMLEMISAKKAIRNNTIEHWERPRSFPNFTVTAQTAGAAGAQVTLTLQATSHLNIGPADGHSSYPQVNDIVLFPDGVQAMIVAKREGSGFVDANEIDVVPLVSTENIPAVSLGDTLFVISNAFAEGTGQPVARGRQPMKWESCVQIIKRSYTVTGSELTSQSWVRITIDENSPLHKKGKLPVGDFWMLNEEAETYKTYLLHKELACILGKKLDNPLILNQTPYQNIQSTSGLLPCIQSHGINPTPYVGGTLNLASFQLYTNLLLRQGNPSAREYFLYAGQQFNNEMDNFLHDLYHNGAVTYAAFEGKKERAIRYGFDTFKVNGYTFHKQVYNLFSHETLLGSPGYDYEGDAFFVPYGTQRDAKSGDNLPMCRRIFKSSKQGYNREIEAWHTGGIPGMGVATNDIDELNFHYRSECGLQLVGLNSFMYVERQ